MSESTRLQSPGIENHPPNFAASFLGERAFDYHANPDATPRPVVNATATGDARMIVGNVNANTTITGEVKNVKVYQFPEIQVGYSSRIAKDDATIRRWLTSTDQTSVYQEILDRREPETNRWFIENGDFERWVSHDPPDYARSDDTDQEENTEQTHGINQDELESAKSAWPRFLWIHGGVGCGKSILCSSIVEKLLNRGGYESTLICYFFFSFRSADRGDLSALLRSLLSQLCDEPTVPGPMVELYMKCHQTFPARLPTLLELKDVTNKVFDKVLQSQKVFLVLDALDEVTWGPQREDVLDFTYELSQNAAKGLQIVVSSRNDTDIRERFASPDTNWKNIPIQYQDVDHDIEKYINNHIEKYPSLKRQDAATKNLIREKLVNNAHGIWSALQLSSLRQLRSSMPNSIKKALEEIPKDLNETYARILAGIDQYSVQLAIHALEWLVASKRTFYIEELADASSSGLQDIEQSPYEFRDTALEPFHLVEMLGDLIEVYPALPDNSPPEPGQHSVSLSHFSVQEFLLREYIKTSPVSRFALTLHEAHFSVARDCLVYLYRFNTPPRRLDSVKARMPGFALREYAWYNWEKHVAPSTTNEFISDPTRRTATMLYTNFKIRSIWTDDERSNTLTSWLPTREKERLLRALNVPYFYPNLGGYFETPLGPHDDPRWFGNNIPDAANKEIALISILPCLDPDDDLRCQLHIVNLRENPDFKAISYALGPADDSPIYIGGSKKSVRPQLASIFRNLRLHQEGQQPRFWADAISLEEWQSNSSSVVIERDRVYYTETRLLVMLTEIFKKAREVMISLGEELPGDEEGISLMYKLIQLTDLALEANQEDEYIGESRLFDEVARLEEENGWSVLNSLFTRTWWQRRWTIQEIVLARTAILFTGNIAFSFDIINRFVEAESLIQKCLLEYHGPLGQGYHEVFGSSSWESIKNLSRSRRDYAEKGSLDLATLIWRFRMHKGMYQEDVLRTIVPLTWTLDYDSSFEVDYQDTHLFRLDLPEAIAKASVKMMKKTVFLRLLSLQSVYSLNTEDEKADVEPQTWLPALEKHAAEVQPFIRCTEDAPKLYSAFGEETLSLQFASKCVGFKLDEFPENKEHDLEITRLSIKGAFFSTVERTSDAYLTGLRDEAILAFARNLADTAVSWIEEQNQKRSDLISVEGGDCSANGDTQSSLPSREDIWRTLLADQYQPDTRLPDQLPCPDLPSSLPPKNDKEVDAFLSVPATRKALKYLYGRRLMLTKSGRIGLAPIGARKGDTIVVFSGGRVPHVIRETSKRMVGHFVNIPLWSYVGECYVHGIMDGEFTLSKSDGESGVAFEPIVLEGEMRKVPDSGRPPWRQDAE
ncbi:unnamed protein product [Periconia digitata]|uniref:NACHT domain-containing protein n=1 Tax=Periconia digitata TaxID=1303443 RepID=A0A9W4UMU6_9PLEO|nr:unnamed protein product [Periconia digitata]